MSALRLVPMPRLPEWYADVARQAEDDLLGLLMINGLESSATQIEPGMFSSVEALSVYLVMLSLDAAGKPVDAHTLCEALEGVGILDVVGGVGGVAAMAASSPDVHPQALAQVLKGFALMRYAMGRADGERVIVPLSMAVENGWLHGKAWRSPGKRLQSKGDLVLGDFDPEAMVWVTNCFIDTEATPQ